MNLSDLLIVALATFYAAYALSSTHGPWHIFQRLRERLPLGGLTGCLVCLSFWAGIGLYALQMTALSPLVSILAIAGASVLVWRYTGGGAV